ncbi:MAG: hypothetical protein HY923_00590 [Elusimicrobia bacterium]|nr:hypothetical protein [Elusimicrobiota bacterium]
MSDAFYVFYLKVIVCAAVFVGAVSAAIYAAARRTDLVRQYCAAHLIALVLGAAVDVAIVKYFMPRGGIPPQYMNAVLLAPIVFFIGFSIYLCHRDTVMHLADVLIPMAPVLAWGVLVVFGWQRGMGDYDVLGAWFVSAGCGGIDLAAKFGPPGLSARPLRTRFAGYLLMLAAVYLFLPLATA